MAQASIPVDLFNPGQVFACLGFLEVAEVLLGHAEGGFDWTDETKPSFTLQAKGEKNPFQVALEFLAETRLQRLAPAGYTDPISKKKTKAKKTNNGDVQTADGEANDSMTPDAPLYTLETFPATEADRLTLPLRLTNGCHYLDLTHWCDGSSRNPCGGSQMISLRTPTIRPCSSLRTESGLVSGAHRSVRPIFRPASSTMLETINIVPGWGAGNPSISPYSTVPSSTELGKPSKSMSSVLRYLVCTLATTSDGGMVTPSMVIACGVRLISFIYHLCFYFVFPTFNDNCQTAKKNTKS